MTPTGSGLVGTATCTAVAGDGGAPSRGTGGEGGILGSTGKGAAKVGVAPGIGIVGGTTLGGAKARIGLGPGVEGLSGARASLTKPRTKLGARA